MAPRLSLRRCFLALLGVTCFLFLVLNIHQREIWARSLAAIQVQQKQKLRRAAANQTFASTLPEPTPNVYIFIFAEFGGGGGGEKMWCLAWLY